MGQNYKHIFIGCGGAGVNTVSIIKKKIYDSQKSTASKSKLDSMNEKYRFLFFDTDQRDIDSYNKKYRETFENGMIPFINPQTDLISLSKGNPHAIFVEAKNNPTPMINQRILEACTDDLAAKIPDQPLKFGAGAFRMKSRLSFARSLSDFQQKLQAAIEDLNSVKNTGGGENTIFYWVVCSTNGGTGSGIINDVLYYVNMQHQRSIGDGDPHLVLTMYMPKFYIDKNSTEDKYSINAFAVFKEIEGIKAMSNDAEKCKIFHRLALLKDYNLINTDARYDPFYYLIPVDCQTDNGTNIGSAMYPNTAEMLFHIHEGEGGEALHSDVDNYMHDLYNLRPKGFLVPMGYIALRKPTAQFEQYMSARLGQDLLQYGIVNQSLTDGKKIDSKVVKEFFDEQFGAKNNSIDFLNQLYEQRKNDVINDTFKDFQDIEDPKYDDKLSEGLIDAAVADFRSTDFSRTKNEATRLIESNLWKKAEDLVLEKGLSYTVEFFKELGKVAKNELTSLSKGENKYTRNKERIDECLTKAKDYALGERFNKQHQIDELNELATALKDAAQGEIDNEINDIRSEILSNFCKKDGEGRIKDLTDHLTNMLNSAVELSVEAQNNYKKLSTNFADLSQDVTSVYLPEMDKICDGNGWIRGNIFSRMYEHLVAVTPDVIEGKDKVPERNGPNSMEAIMRKLYEKGSDVIAKEISKEFAVKREVEKEVAADEVTSDEKEPSMVSSVEDIRFFANQGKLDNTKGIIEKFVVFAKRFFEKRYREDEYVKSNWLDKPIYKFFESLDIENRERVRRSLNPSLFFNYKENKLAVDYREFLIFVAKTKELASDMLGYQDGNMKHRCIQGTDDNAALVIRAKYGLSFSDYRLYDTMEEQYEKAPNRDKYHFHHYFAEFGENIRMEDLPFEISQAHRTFTKMILLNKYTPIFDKLGFFYKSKYSSKAADFANAFLVEKTPSSFSIARPGALSEDAADGTLCMKVVDKNARLFADFEGNNFVEAFDSYRKNFIRNAIADSFDKFLNAVVRHSVLVTDQVQDGLAEVIGRPVRFEKGQQLTGGAIIEEFYEDRVDENGKEILGYRSALLQEFDNKIQAAHTEKEKALYRIFMYVLENELVTAKIFMTGKEK